MMVLSEGQRFAAQPPVQSTALAAPYFAGANEMGQVMVLEYHRIGYPEQRYQRTLKTCGPIWNAFIKAATTR
ncbi:MAG: hypothetical protein HS114_24760 [Anaerolineales bacterium]|nr:hypothetical protein [Anaerolineales bacterium]